MITINAPPPAGEPGRAPTGFSPTELLLAGAGACAAWDVIEMLRKRRARLGDLEITVEGSQADSPPWPYERVGLHFLVRCDGVTAGVLDRLIRLAIVRYCSVIATLRGVARIEATFELIGQHGASSGRRVVRLAVAVAQPLDDRPPDEPARDED